ncbi:FAD/NAD(P)-binding protein [candidate division WOR-3 bacterium]|nr:FAD/NAD(P)-binding protein [candidate division WOR-3 bacterium]
MPMVNPYKPVKAKLKKIVDETPNIKTFTLVLEEQMEFKTGQFVQFTVPEVGEAPFTPSSSPYVKDQMEITIMSAGRVTEAIHSLKEGDTVGIRGPLGKGYPLEEFKGKEVLILGGGVGMAPLRSLLLTLIAQKKDFKRILLLYGAKTPQDIIYKGQFADWRKEGVEIHRSVDNGDEDWKEKVGVVTVLLDDVKLGKEVVIICGPPIMMKFGTLSVLEMGYKPENIYLSMEKNMSCGIGKCGHCALGHYFVCKDGPVFKYSEIKDIEGIWD